MPLQTRQTAVPGRDGGTSVVRRINFPGNSSSIELVENGGYIERRVVLQVCAGWVCVAMRSRREKIHAVDLGTVHHRRKPAIRRSKIRRHEIVIVKIARVVITHGALAGRIG